MFSTAVLVPIDKFRIGFDGKRYNDPDDKSTQVIPDAKTSVVEQAENTTEEVVKPVAKRTTTRK